MELVQSLQNQQPKEPGEAIGIHHTALRRPISPAEFSSCIITVTTFLYHDQNLVQLIDNLVTENSELWQQLTRKEAELTRAVETARREQQLVR